jgi:hypothetical protein
MKTKSIIEKSKWSLFTGILILTVFSFAYAQQKPSFAFSSFERAKQILDAATATHGRLENIRRADKIAINYRSVNHQLGQNSAFDARRPISFRTK